MEFFRYCNGILYCEDVPVPQIAAKTGTPFYLYSGSALEHHYRSFDDAFASVPHLTCYAVKANANLAILSLFRSLGAGFDIVSGGELRRVLAAGASPKKIVFSGVGKTPEEMDLALHRGILQFNVESEAELKTLAARAKSCHKTAVVSLRINPDVDAATHPYIETGTREHKFGIGADRALELVRMARRSRYLRIAGIGCHIGSQITSIAPFVAAMERLHDLVVQLRSDGATLFHLDLGGGLGIVYNDSDEAPPHPAEYARALLKVVDGLGCMLILEPGRVLAGNAGILVTRVLRTKQNGSRNFIVVDAGMSDLIRPSLYGAFHGIRPVVLNRRRRWKADVVGPLCESGDYFARDRDMAVVREQDLLAVMSAGAYGFALASNYNSRPRPPEMMVRGNRVRCIRRREKFQDLIRGERPGR